ncbi:hypothetical protein [Mycobacteroides abscessus]|uniref:hypothetical protein n=1 Tax=Mycobacteroides abscessus TaxID=36809 RepID=UPI001F41CF0F|nr:hypothetical protein [Mycobacteroides abscessus]
MTTISQSRPRAMKLVGLVVALGVGVVGCSTEHPTPSGSSSTGESSSSAVARNLVDVSAVWASHPLPDCPRLVGGNLTAPAGLELPSDETVANQLAGVRSPAPESWVRIKLGWLTQELAATRADIIDANLHGDRSMLDGFDQYVRHLRDELQVGHDISDPVDKTYPEGCS